MSVCSECCVPDCWLDAGLLARIQYSEGPATGHLDTGFSRFPCVYKQMLRWFLTFQVATTCFSCSPSDLSLLVTNFMFCIHVKQPLAPGDNPIAVNKYIILYYIILSGRVLCDGLITLPEESYRMWCVAVCDLETSWMRRPAGKGGGAVAPETNKLIITAHCCMSVFTNCPYLEMSVLQTVHQLQDYIKPPGLTNISCLCSDYRHVGPNTRCVLTVERFRQIVISLLFL